MSVAECPDWTKKLQDYSICFYFVSVNQKPPTTFSLRAHFWNLSSLSVGSDGSSSERRSNITTTNNNLTSTHLTSPHLTSSHGHMRRSLWTLLMLPLRFGVVVSMISRSCVMLQDNMFSLLSISDNNTPIMITEWLRRIESPLKLTGPLLLFPFSFSLSLSLYQLESTSLHSSDA